MQSRDFARNDGCKEGQPLSLNTVLTKNALFSYKSGLDRLRVPLDKGIIPVTCF